MRFVLAILFLTPLTSMAAQLSCKATQKRELVKALNRDGIKALWKSLNVDIDKGVAYVPKQDLNQLKYPHFDLGSKRNSHTLTLDYHFIPGDNNVGGCMVTSAVEIADAIATQADEPEEVLPIVPLLDGAKSDNSQKIDGVEYKKASSGPVFEKAERTIQPEGGGTQDPGIIN